MKKILVLMLLSCGIGLAQNPQNLNNILTISWGASGNPSCVWIFTPTFGTNTGTISTPCAPSLVGSLNFQQNGSALGSGGTLNCGTNISCSFNSGILTITGNAGGSATWGAITGTLSSQTDLQTALNAKQPSITFQQGGTTVGSGVTTINCSTNVTCSLSGSTLTVTSTGGSGSNATSLQGNAIQSGTATTTGQAYLWNSATNQFELNLIQSLQNGLGNCIVTVSAGLQEVNNCNIPNLINITSDVITNADCGNTKIYENSGATSVTIGPANTGGNFVDGCTIDIVSWLATTTITTSVSQFFSLTGTPSSTFNVSAGTSKQFRSRLGNYYQTR